MYFLFRIFDFSICQGNYLGFVLWPPSLLGCGGRLIPKCSVVYLFFPKTKNTGHGNTPTRGRGGVSACMKRAEPNPRHRTSPSQRVVRFVFLSRALCHIFSWARPVLIEAHFLVSGPKMTFGGFKIGPKSWRVLQKWRSRNSSSKSPESAEFNYRGHGPRYGTYPLEAPGVRMTRVHKQTPSNKRSYIQTL